MEEVTKVRHVIKVTVRSTRYETSFKDFLSVLVATNVKDGSELDEVFLKNSIGLTLERAMKHLIRENWNEKDDYVREQWWWDDEYRDHVRHDFPLNGVSDVIETGVPSWVDMKWDEEGYADKINFPSGKNVYKMLVDGIIEGIMMEKMSE